ncbi:hypothetical protein AKN87_06845 [Thiopseudomonas alkaliphila]|uniref:RDD family protein n=1 Tax=Thiopseudomonas alkaliphila TaxID=1697053 RepID=A0A0K1XDE3_9GAMM|nr:RDD family protein [Thiopseudomonas alkaliphila]AKX44849.1 hypothetical protein AKN87_06845 [Thiopseudomonas alkaliphila]AKX47566.1 hypothetical protein AKN94_09525 [Thiopseudomonas alkaliphila]AKX48218.1 hypothetical protein AKN93_01435 [Thiopseudomonas alkaliphila]AKX51422.1 hypothetical protein AKN92_07935 [Thiopseudomonas alkaliphila]AKX55670.1 hypothetical protein AKN90_08100 [Thiopseudomonas alkaliphila]
MAKPLLKPSGNFPLAGLGKRLAAMFYDSLLVIALVMVLTLIYQQVVLRLIYGADKLQQLSESGQLDIDPLLSTLLLFSVFAFFAKFWTHTGQTLGMQVWGVRVQNKDGSAISLWQALLRFFVAIPSLLLGGLGYFWLVFSAKKATWHDLYSDSVVIQLPKNAHKK